MGQTKQNGVAVLFGFVLYKPLAFLAFPLYLVQYFIYKYSFIGMKRKPGDRPEFLSALINEFYTSQLPGSRQEVIANLANFAYNPDNYMYMRDLNVIKVFIDALDDSNSNISHFALSGLCNLAADPENKVIICASKGVQKVSKLLNSNRNETILVAVATLIFLVSPASHSNITSPENVKRILDLSHNQDKRLKNLATVFLEDICSKEQVDLAKSQKNDIASGK